MNILLWHVHGSWTTAFVQGPHTYLVPVTPDRGPDGLGRARTFPWPESVVEKTPAELRHAPVDLVVLQRPHEAELAERWLGGRRPGRDVPAVYLEHNAPDGDVPHTRHPCADRDDLVLVHVTHFNRLFWDSGGTRTEVIEHGIVDPGHLYTGAVERAAVVVNEPVRRGRTVGTDLLPALSAAVPLDVFGMRTDGLAEHLGLPPDRCRTADLPQAELHAAMAERRLYLHPVRWTSLGLSLLEAMHLGMPVVALATTEAAEAVRPGTGTLSNRPEVLARAARTYLEDPDAAAEDGARARQAALERYGLKRFLHDWERLITEVQR
ncbi:MULTISPECIES: glycosyltransferase [Streptomyces]|uniref:D-inositol 3-phosphate glycosyltransferase n=2 Tax=Streptomyces rimosus subsp. rimosus TaxID=132474 RepID=L8EDT0_STRR1|nr:MULTISPECIES: glycosyltransferase [Streptomyces]KOG74663.1 glycosyl transferase [Kitasatospora aureofaciens]MYT48366.1 glycosyltransferase [Streptomyces sp. SID5471]KEF03429.1 glycosyl transferase [Streptomyces rimosus]KEF17187.1 glycosyl transferase [Streptomyces rimosus]KOT29682.1 glycosyl transferase [Streptomyces rimosus subsp. rimosus]